MDVVIMDKESGKFRIGYQLTNGVLSWGDCRPTGEKGVTGFTIGKLIDAKHDAIAVVSPDSDHFVMVEASDPTSTARPKPVPFDAALGPSTIVAIDIGGAGNTPEPDFYIASIHNSPDPNQASLVRNENGKFSSLADVPLTGSAVEGNRVALKTGGPEALAEIVRGEKADTFLLEDFHTGKPADLVKIADLASSSEYAAGHFSKKPTLDFLFYKPGEPKLAFRAGEEKGGGEFQ